MTEEWRACVGFPDYEVSSHGRVRRITPAKTRGKVPYIVTGGTCSAGYRRVKIMLPDGSKRTAKVHRLVAEAFLPNPEGKPQVAHGNGVRHDNRLSNLRWATSKENLDDREAHGTELRGRRNGRAKLSEGDVRSIRSRLTGRYGEVAELAREYGMAHSSMHSICTGKHWSHA